MLGLDLGSGSGVDVLQHRVRLPNPRMPPTSATEAELPQGAYSGAELGSVG